MGFGSRWCPPSSPSPTPQATLFPLFPKVLDLSCPCASQAPLFGLSLFPETLHTGCSQNCSRGARTSRSLPSCSPEPPPHTTCGALPVPPPCTACRRAALLFLSNSQQPLRLERPGELLSLYLSAKPVVTSSLSGESPWWLCPLSSSRHAGDCYLEGTPGAGLALLSPWSVTLLSPSS